MTRITGSDQTLALLKAQLQETSRAGRTSKTAKAAGARRSSVERFRERPEDEPEEERHRALIRALLADRLGPEAANDPSFQSVAAEVAAMIRAEPDGKRLLRDACEQVMTR